MNYLIRWLCFGYCFTQIIFFKQYVIIPKLVAAILALSVIVAIFLGRKIARGNWSLLVLLLFILHAGMTFFFEPDRFLLTTFPSFTLVALNIFFLYQGLVLGKAAKFGLWGIVFGIWANILLMISNVGFLELFDGSRLVGTFGNPNYFGYMVNLSVVIFLLLQSKAKRDIPWPVLCYWAISLGLILSTGSRSNLVISIVIFLFMAVRKVLTLRFASKVAVIGLFLFLFSVIPLIVDTTSSSALQIGEVQSTRLTRLKSRLEGNTSLDGSEKLRLSMFMYGLDNWREEPFFGHGFDGFTTKAGFPGYSHSNLIENLYNGGLIMTILFYSNYVYLLILIFRLKNRETGLIAIMFATIFVVMELTTVIIDDKIFWTLIISLTVLLKQEADEEGEEDIVVHS